MTQHDQATRALDAPFTPPDDWDPIPGTCTRCGQPAWLGETKWWHNAEPCQSRGRTADFLPD
ncbi:hypothetical protein OG455_41280 [Kitasatospora sp. NBC_01287]|uniref:hypothetical protein n=1 Tax=Kitasatospora sp. NBC_01287 TaxID=2903573 RepID=UPI002259780A|nr:hypothetical protein [Kitasatospora sp. NBC_01287]MCX4750916.1 hypothetical protein [Kitasatospora sp. NBC_01287]MCX4751833.1 hypothetical protein [Kitasatospora sp. NBC_01287]MCX4751875.1 hypothetical protein [Kitasatospora sp. NBC_01287]